MNRLLRKTIFIGIVLYVCLSNVLYAQQLVPDSSFNAGGAGAGGNVLKHHVFPDGKILIAGSFQNYNYITKRGIARLNSDGTLDGTFMPTGDGITSYTQVNDFAIQPDGKIILVGTFSNFSAAAGQNVGVNKVARINADGTVLDALSISIFQYVSSVNGIALQSNGKIIMVGNFTSLIGGKSIQGIVRLNTDGTVDHTFTPDGGGFNSGGIQSVAIDANDRIYLGGTFTMYGSTSVGCFVRLNSNGSLDTSFSPASSQANGVVNAIKVLNDGKVLIAGSFTQYRKGSGSFVLKNRIARLNSDGSVDTGFLNGYSGVSSTSTVYGLTVQTDNKILITGDFSNVNGVSANRLFRLNADGSTDNTFNIGSGTNFTISTASQLPDGKILIGGGMGTFNGANMPFGFGRLLVKQSQTISFSTLPAAGTTTKVYGDQPITLDGTASSGLPVTYTLTPANQTAISISGNTLTIIGTGSVVITATQAGNANYNPVTSTGRTLVVNPKPVSITGIQVADKVYDASITATATGGTLQGVLDGDVVNIIPGFASFDNKNAGTGKTVSFSGYSLGGAKATNYSMASQPASTTANITKASVTMFVDASNANRLYNATTSVPLSSIYLTKKKDGDIVNLNHGTYAFADKHVGNNKPVIFTGYSISGVDAGNYDFELPTVTANVLPSPINVSGITASNREYDGTTNATITNNGTLINVLPGDNVSIENVTGVFANKNIGTRSITVNITLAGTDAANYTVNAPSVSATITSKDISITGITANNKEYDGGTNATLSGTPVLSGVMPEDDVALNGNTPIANFVDRHVGTGKKVEIFNLTLAGTDYFNYNLLTPELTADISKKQISIDGITVSNKVYDGTTVATYNGATLTGKYPIDNVFLVQGTAAFSDKNAGENKTIEFTGFSLGGLDANNYTLAPITNKTASITPKSIGVNNVVIGAKEYDGTTNATVTDPGTLYNLISGDDVAIDASELVATLDFKDVGPQYASITGYKLTGADAVNYTITGTPQVFVSISPKSISVEGIVVNDKVYDGGLYTTISNTGSLSGVIPGDVVTLNAPAPTARFADKNVGTGKTVTLDGYWINGTNSGNYTLANPTATANITPKEITINGMTVNGKVYDGTTTVIFSGGFLSGTVGGDNPMITLGTGAFSDKNVGNNKTVTFSGFGLAGAGSTNYTLKQPTATASIWGKPIFVFSAKVADKVYDGSTNATLESIGNLDGKVNGDDVTLVAPSSIAFQTKTVGNNKTVISFGHSLSGTDAINYILNQPTLTGNILKKELTVTGTVVANKMYDGGTSTVLTNQGNLQGVISGDQVTLTADYIVHFQDKNVGENKPVVLTNLMLHNADASNYSVVTPSVTADITPKVISTQNIIPADKVYDGTDELTFNKGNLAGVISGENVDAVLNGKFVNKNAGVSKEIIFTVQLTGTHAGNYTHQSLEGYTATIHQREVTLTGVSVANKTYDGTTAATLVGTPALNNVITGDDVNLNTTPESFAFSSPDAGVVPIAITDLTLTGNDALNYKMGVLPNVTANIFKATPVINNFVDIFKAISDPAFSLAATTNSSAYISYSVVGTNNILNLNGNTVTLNGQAGSATIRASVAATTNFNAATKDITINVSALPAPEITFNNVSKVYTDGPFTVTATSNSNGAIQYALVSGNGIVSPSGEVTITGAGQIVVQAIQASTATFSGATKTATITVAKAPLAAHADNKTRMYGEANPAFTITYTGFKAGENALNSGITAPATSTTANFQSAIGTYPIVLTGGNGGANYELTRSNGELTINKGVATVALSHLTTTYNGTHQSATVTTTPAGVQTQVVYKQNGVVVTPVNAGVYTVEVLITDPNFESIPQITENFTINKATATIALHSLTTTYSGTSRTITVITEPAGIANTVTYKQNGQIINNVINAGVYDVEVSLNDPNYDPLTLTDVFTVEKAIAEITLSDLTTTYDGSVKSVTVTTNPVGLNYEVLYRQNGEVVEPVNAGTYEVEVIVVNDVNYEGAATADMLTINKAVATISVSGLTATFDGSSKEVTVTTTPANVSVLTTYLQNGNQVAEVHYAGAYDVHVSINDMNYEGEPVTATLQINKGQANITFTNAVSTYNGTPKFINVVTEPNGLETQVELVYKQNGAVITEPVDAGEYEVEATLVDANWGATATGLLTINRAMATATISDLVTTYDGTVKQVSVETEPAGLNYTLTYVLNGTEVNEVVNAGSYEVAVMVDDMNYTSEIISEAFTVNKAQANIAVTGLVATYDGTAKTANITTEPAGLTTATIYKKDGVEVNEALNAGTYQVEVFVDDINYQSETVSTTITINRAAATISTEDVTAVFDGTEKPVIVTTTPAGLAVEVAYTKNGIEVNTPLNVGVYQAVASVADLNYEATPATATVTITKTQATLALSNLETTYDGNVKSITVTTTPAGLFTEVVYKQNGVVVTPINAGTYDVEVSILDENSDNADASATFTINKATPVITLNDLTATYNGSAMYADVVVQPAGLNTEVTYKQNGVTVNEPINAGEYEIEVSVIDDNSEVVSVNDVFIINKATAVITLTNLSTTYDGTVKHAIASTEPVGLNAEVTYKHNGQIVTEPINAGVYEVEAFVNEANYSSEIVQETLTINQIVTTLSGANTTTTYDGTPKSIEVIVSPANRPLIITYNGSTTAPVNAGTYNVVATSEGDENHTDATVELVLTIEKAEQIITFTPVEDKFNTSEPFAITAVSSSGLPVTITITEGPATISGSIVTLTGGIGEVVFLMSQAGDDNHLPVEMAGTFQVDEDLILSTEGSFEKMVSVYPVPAKDVITVNAGGMSIKSIRLFNASGMLITELNDLQGNKEEKISVSDIANGVIMIEVLTIDNKRVLKRGFIKK